MTAPVIDEDVDAGYWRARAGQAEALVAELRAENAGLTARVAELAGQVDRLLESVTTLSGLLFGSSSEKGGSPLRRTGRAGGDRPGGAGKRGQRPGGPGHGRRDYSHLETGERVIDVEAGQRCCAECGKAFEFLGTEDSEQIDWQGRSPGSCGGGGATGGGALIRAGDGLRAAGGQAGAEGPVHRRVPGPAGA